MGNTVTITGTNFTGVTAVSFGGVAAASFIEVSATKITAVVPLGASGSVNVTTPVQMVSKAGFYYLALSGVITDFEGYWATTTAANNSVTPDNSHNLLAFTYNGITYSTGVNNSILTGQGIGYTPSVFKSLPVANIAGTNSASSIYLAMSSKVDGNASVANASVLAGLTIKDVMTDGLNGLDLGTGVTNLPASAIMTFGLSITHPEKISDDQPDIIITQIADPTTANDNFQFLNAAGNLVGNSITQNMNLLTKFGSYTTDLFYLGPGDPFNSAVCYSAFSTNAPKEIRLVGFKLSDFGITAANYTQVVALKITPSGTSDYAFIAYSDGLEMYPNISPNLEKTNSSVCLGGTANLEVITTAASGGTLSYSWQESTDGGLTWSAVINGGAYSGAITNRLTIVSATNNYKYRAIVTESGNGYSTTSSLFSIVAVAPAAPTAVTISASGTTTCLNTLISFSCTVTGGSNLFYQWQSNASGSYLDIPGAILKTYLPPVNATGSISYQLKVSSGSGCAGAATSAQVAIAVVGISSVTPSSRCGTGVVAMSAAATSGTISWYSASIGGTPLATGTTYAPSISATATYYVSTDASQCTSGGRVPVTATINTITWAGTNTTEWSTLANWDCGGVPPSSLPIFTSNVTIPAIPTGGRFPNITTTAPINNITVSTGASITVDSTGVFEIYGVISNSGTFTATKGTVSMRGAVQQAIPANAFSTNTIKNLTINNTAGVLIGGELNLTGTYTPTAGVLTTFGYLTLKSSSSATARVAQGTGTYTNGNVNVERYIPPRRSWRLMTAPVTNSNTFYQSWQNNGVFEVGKGLLVTAPGGGIGIDASGYSSLKTWNVASQSFQVVYNTKVPISATHTGTADNTGYFIFIRGDRDWGNIDPNLIRKNATTLTSTGYLQTSTQNFTNLSAIAGGFSLVGNPYASPIDWNLVLANVGTANIKRKFYVWDPKLNSVGGYVVMDDVLTPGAFSPTPVTSSQDNFIQSSQALYIITNTAGAASVQIKETNKVLANSMGIFGRPMEITASLIMDLLLLTPADSSTIVADGARADFNDVFSAAIDDNDNLKYANINETFGLVRNNIFLATERRPAVTYKDTLFLRLTRTTQRAYQFQFNPLNFSNTILVARLEDSYTGVSTRLSLTGMTRINFVVNTDAGSQAADRFRVVFTEQGPLAVTFSSVQANPQKDNIAVEWEVENELNISKYEIERSGNGSGFSKMGTIAAHGNNLLNAVYNWVDADVINGDNFYRIKSIGLDGKGKYSRVVKVKMDRIDAAIIVYPNPVVNKIMNVQFNNQPAGSYTLKISSATGQLLMIKTLYHTGGTDTKPIPLPDTIEMGNYQLSITGKELNGASIKVFVQ
ncbi:MAG: hypothetical protein ABI707_13955 [Ferruginibacter sp.]